MRRRSARALALGAVILGFLIAVSWSEERRVERAAAPERERLASLIAARESQTRTLEARIRQLRAQLDAATTGSGEAASIRATADRLAALAGRAPVAGPGVLVEVVDGDVTGSSEDAGDSRVQDVDLQLVVNALWAAGAEAVAVNGERIVTTTAIRSAGTSILVNFRVLSSPYRVAAIGDPDALVARFNASEIAERFRRWADIYGLGLTMKTERRLELPASAEALRFRYATAAAGS